ncbi:MAG: pantoate--beta-alanine ligase [Desulfobacterales bacterium]|nr:MAG: pantoate--beta-alanine ligase [Desulfobacterales bacterium]
MEIIESTKMMADYSQKLREKGNTIALVPTMGFLHKGHLSLMEAAKSHADTILVSIFVNPTQFGPNEDLDTYPRDMERDLALCRDMGVSAVFTPTVEELYPQDFQTYVELTRLPLHLCGLSRPGFFRGVATVVSKLFHITCPHVAMFGEKDFQQLVVIRQMVKDMCMPIKIVGVPIVRESDGLAMSSRNAYLTPEQRSNALLLSKSLENAKKMTAQGETDASKILRQTRQILLSCPDMKIDYVSICDPDSLEETDRIQAPALLALAATLGKTRLIDNCILTP